LDAGLSYYGTVLIAPEFFQTSSDPTHFNFQALFLTSLAEVVGCTLAFLLIDRGRKPLASWSYTICGCCTLVLVAGAAMPKWTGILVLMLARGAIFMGTSATWVITPELYPTFIRAAGHSWCNALARVGAFCTPFWGNATAIPIGWRLAFYAIMDLIAAAATFSLPRETSGMALMD
jgi:hypothetical protein